MIQEVQVMSKAASRSELNELHKAMAEYFRSKLQNQSQDNPMSAAELGVILKFLADSGIKADESGANQILDDDTRAKLREQFKKHQRHEHMSGDTTDG